ncbi:ABC transporter ATP-binding protein [Rhabdochromatium marinum]|uniref:ABC transporter ATP-binding protein n=1 Tax=Rhabdochromatium marinum TaxID=48729 RepID=UPI001904CA68|nr:ABC transporter ATP-binding protein [Rhabdochromatium marinum]MBK1647417.1 ABC transporter [Rhabdochromatium marinum]
MTLLEVEGLTVQLGGRPRVRGVSLRLAAGELLGLIGPNGAGKSTLLKALVQSLPYTGQLRLLGEDPLKCTAQVRARRLAYLSQEDRIQWPMTLTDLVALGRHPYQNVWHGGTWLSSWSGARAPSHADHQAIERALRTTDLWPLRNRRVTELSGGERARARLARALAVEAPLLLADEPVAALDPLHQLKVMHYLRAYCHPTTPEPGRAAIVVMHDLTLASRFCDRLLLLHQGECQALGRPETVLNPEHLQRIYGIRALTGHQDGQSYVLPWALSDPAG